MIDPCHLLLFTIVLGQARRFNLHIHASCSFREVATARLTCSDLQKIDALRKERTDAEETQPVTPSGPCKVDSAPTVQQQEGSYKVSTFSNPVTYTVPNTFSQHHSCMAHAMATAL